MLQTNGEAHAIITTKTGQLPRATKDRETYIGIKVNRTGAHAKYLRVVFTVPRTMLARIGNPARVTIRGTPRNGYLILAGDDCTPSIAENCANAYLYVSAERARLEGGERGPIWMRAEVEDRKRIRVPSLPVEWIGGAYEEGKRTMAVSRTAGDDPIRCEPSQAKPLNGSPTVPLPKPTPSYQLPEGMNIADAQVLLGRKLDEARAIVREVEKRTGLRFTLTRNFVLVVDLSGR
jgi:hypothetical protein